MGLTLEGGNRTSRIAARIVPHMPRSLRPPPSGHWDVSQSSPTLPTQQYLTGNMSQGLIRRHQSRPVYEASAPPSGGSAIYCSGGNRPECGGL